MYTSHGYMTPADLVDHESLTDTGTVTYAPDDLPWWLSEAAECPRCGWELAEHDAVTVDRASGQILCEKI